VQVFALAEALHDNKHVTHLDLSYNNIDDAGVSTLSRLLKFNQSLKELDLEGNNISPEGAKKLAETLSEDNGGGAGTTRKQPFCFRLVAVQ
jgi:Ran GTPase-activating protein (RanGAP) involved in mRNA processing and transport